MKLTTVVFITFVVVGMSSLAPIKSSLVVNSVKPPCTEIEITGCVPAILVGTKPSDACCGKLRAQQPCFCDFIKNPGFHNLVTSPQARAALGFCGIPFPTC
ncbi:putative non-specific lipid-transfer protein AKCS9 [Cardamine amara subsp. amara]|uniref:Non-specific lipid-transfer protein AKCS9 n=1 Tax=Cardamine amara subsp. amara TaxID=228776 RepID=A0ABD0ZSW1_CARAN